MPASLSGWLQTDAARVGLVTVDDHVQPMDYEITAILAQLEPTDRPPVHFPRVSALDGSTSTFGMVFNAYASLDSLSAVVGVPCESWRELLDHYLEREQALREPEPTDRIPAQHHVAEGDDIDLRTLPWTRHVELDGGPYFTPITVSRKPADHGHNLSWNRAMYLDPRHVGVHVSPRQLWGLHRAAERTGGDLPVALVLGHHPAFNLASAARTPLDVDEYAIAGALLGEPLAVAPSVTHGDRLLVPAEAEIVLEGRLLAGRRCAEGPFGEFMRYLGPQKLSHVLEVDAVTWRDGANVLGVFAGHTDHLNAHVSIHASLLRNVRSNVPEVRAIGWFEGGGPTTLVIGLAKTVEGQPMRAAMAAMAQSNTVKQVIVVDDDVDVFDSAQVMWAVSTRVRADEDIAIVPNLQGHLLDPSQQGYAKTTGLVIDATWPQGAPVPPVARVPDVAVERFPLAHYHLRRS